MKVTLEIEMPKNCEICPAYYEEENVCQLKWYLGEHTGTYWIERCRLDDFTTNAQVAEWCPLKQARCNS